jgi:hypothetical protein
MARTTRQRCPYYYHVTHKDAVASILRTGIDPVYAVSPKRKAVWMVAQSKVEWAIVHVLGKPRNRGATLDDLRVLEVRVHHSGTTRYRTGTRYTSRVVPARKIHRVRLATEFGVTQESDV